MPNYKYLEHRSDLLIEGSGPSFAGAVESVAQGLFNSISSASSKPASNSQVVKFTETGIDTQDLVINIFTRVLAEMDMHAKIGISLKILSYDPIKNTACAELELAEGKARLHVKAVTFHEFMLEQVQGGNTVLRVLFDI
ncbi:MAG: archease [Candidatus Micrarchaeota archaeon]|nr:archease [Candidatus Micrarchaeota archaeon]